MEDLLCSLWQDKDPYFINFKLFLTYWLMSSSRDDAMSVSDTHIQDQMALPALPPPLPMSTSTPSLQQQQQPSLQHMQATSSVGTPDKNHLCTVCLKAFRSKQQLNQHSLVHSGIRKHDCAYCDKSFKQLSHLQQHIRIHTGESRALFTCKYTCRYIRIHTGESRALFTCKYTCR